MQNFSAIFLVKEKFEERREIVFQKFWTYPTGNVFGSPHYTPQNQNSIRPKTQLVVHTVHIFLISYFILGWFVGTSQRTGIFGTFPGNYVAKA